MKTPLIALPVLTLLLSQMTLAQSLPADDRRLTALSTDNPDAQRQASEELAAVGAPAVPPLAAMLDRAAGNPRAAKMAYETLFRMVQTYAGMDRAPEVEQALVRELQAAHSAETKRSLCMLLGHIAEQNASIDALYITMNDKEVAESARLALSRIPNRRASQCLVGALQITADDARLGVIASLGLRGEPMAASYIAPGVIKGDPATARAVIDALALLPSPQSFAALKELLKEGKAGAASALIRLMETVIDAEMFQPAEHVLKAVLEASSLAVPERCRLLHACGRLGTTDAVSIVFSALKDENIRVRAAAVQACALFPSTDLTTAVADQMAQASGSLKADLLEALGERGRWMNDAAAGKIIDALADPDESVRLAAIRAIQTAGIHSAVPALVKIVSGPAGGLRDAAEQALSHMPGDAATAAITKALDEATPDARARLAAALARRGSSTAPRAPEDKAAASKPGKQ
jgi:HEAT repeat protein